MLSILLFGLIASAYAAPSYNINYRHHEPRFPDYRIRMDPYGELFDTRRFWAELDREMREFETMMTEFSSHFPSSVSREGVEGNEYVVTIPLSSYEEKDIVVKAREGLLMIQAKHTYEGGATSSYLDLRNLPSNVVLRGTWTFENSILKIAFPLKEGVNNSVGTVNVLTTDQTTELPNFDAREEIDENQDNAAVHGDADVGLTVGAQQPSDTEVLTNEISNNAVEATTYAVDLRDDVEFVPAKY
ncbi:uncharacterized protein LOC142977489 [Anticarsia gemmatalis]|uniref:uncharacterized protein LOC142977489 n=1 Tax=Anticarsia gemmatalis TaxID=129554 RepID=UPI003F77260D